MFLVNLYGYHQIEGAEQQAFFGQNTVVLIRDRFLIPAEIRRRETGDWTEGFGEIRIDHELSRFTIRRNQDGTYTVAWYPPGWQPFRFTGTLSQCAEWYNENKFLEAFH
jgi:hypothetical protein